MSRDLLLEMEIKRVKAVADILDTVSSSRIEDFNHKAGILTHKAWKELKQAVKFIETEEKRTK